LQIAVGDHNEVFAVKFQIKGWGDKDSELGIPPSNLKYHPL